MVHLPWHLRYGLPSEMKPEGRVVTCYVMTRNFHHTLFLDIRDTSTILRKFWVTHNLFPFSDLATRLYKRHNKVKSNKKATARLHVNSNNKCSSHMSTTEQLMLAQIWFCKCFSGNKLTLSWLLTWCVSLNYHVVTIATRITCRLNFATVFLNREIKNFIPGRPASLLWTVQIRSRRFQILAFTASPCM